MKAARLFPLIREDETHIFNDRVFIINPVINLIALSIESRTFSNVETVFIIRNNDINNMTNSKLNFMTEDDEVMNNDD